MKTLRLVFLALFVSVLGSAAQPPNIIVILADDLGCRDLKLYDGWIGTPRIERMAKEGMTFTDFHANSSVCSPTRTAFLTGRYQQRAGIVDVIVGDREPNQGIPASTPTLGQVFKKGGYATALFGKWHCGYQDKFNPIHQGFNEFVGLLNGAGDYHRHGSWRNGLKRQDVKGYSTDVITGKSVDFIKRHKDQPFFLYVAHQTPHNPYQTRTDTPENRKKGWKQNRINDENRPRYLEMVKDLDASIGTIIDTVRESGLADNTLVFFWSDNGDVTMSPVAGRLRGRKFSQYEGGHRVPAVAWWPGKIKAGTQSDALLVGFDLFPTFTDLAGISDGNPDNLDGASAKEHFLSQESFPDRDIFFGYEPKLGTAMRRENWKMIIKGDDLQLFDLAKDLKETTNIATENPQITASMRQAIEHFKQTVVPGS
ncbi:MAG: sulfatase-like hydrolase/transferase [Limisphaerales bacterium]